MARNWKGVNVSNIDDPVVRSIVSQVDTYLQDVAASIQRLGRGEQVNSPSAMVAAPVRVALTENNELINITGILNKIMQFSASGVQTINLIDVPTPGMYRVTCYLYMVTALADTMSVQVNFDNGTGPLSFIISDPAALLNAHDHQTGSCVFFHNTTDPISVTVTPSNLTRLYNLHLLIEAL